MSRSASKITSPGNDDIPPIDILIIAASKGDEFAIDLFNRLDADPDPKNQDRIIILILLDKNATTIQKLVAKATVVIISSTITILPQHICHRLTHAQTACLQNGHNGGVKKQLENHFGQPVNCFPI
jgi:hypothetical protein